jgi:hypothetical protein
MQQPVAALDGGIKCGPRGLLAAKGLLQFIVDHVANQHQRSERTPREFSVEPFFPAIDIIIRG